MANIKIDLWECICAQSVLVSHHYKLIAFAFEGQKRWYDSGYKCDFAEVIYLIILGLDIQGSITIKEYNFYSHLALSTKSSSALIRASFCSFKPMVILAQFFNSGLSLNSRMRIFLSARCERIVFKLLK